MRYQAILFDLDNTLYDYDAYWRWRLRRSLRPVQVAYPRFADDTALAALIAQMMQQRVYARELPAFLQQLGIADEAVIAESQALYRQNNYQRLCLYAGTEALFAHLRRCGCKIGLITNGPAFTQRPKIEQLHLAPHMDVLLISEEVGIAKPDPTIFKLALQTLEVAPAQALYVGDSLEHDLLGSHAAGLDFAWINAANRPLPIHMPMPQATIQRPDELLGLLAGR